MRTARRFELRTQSANHAHPGSVLDCWFVGHRAGVDRALTERRRPAGPSPTCGVDDHNIERGPIFVDGHKSLAPVPADRDLEARDPAQRALLKVGKDPLHERMPGGKKVEGLLL